METKSAEEVSKRRVLEWIGGRREEMGVDTDPVVLVQRIAELEAQVESLSQRTDLSQLSEEELESMAAQTAVAILQTIHTREAEAKKAAAAAIDAANAQANSLVDAATKRANELTASAEQNAANAIAAGQSQASDLVAQAQREADQARAAATQQANNLIADAQASAERTRAEAQDFSAQTRAQAEAEAAALRKQLADLVARTKQAHATVVENQQKLRQSAEAALAISLEAANTLDTL